MAQTQSNPMNKKKGMNNPSMRRNAPLVEDAQIAGIDLSPWMERATEMLTARPGLTIGIAVGTGFILGLSTVSKLGRVLLVSALGLGADLVQKQIRAAMENGVANVMDASNDAASA